MVVTSTALVPRINFDNLKDARGFVEQLENTCPIADTQGARVVLQYHQSVHHIVNHLLRDHLLSRVAEVDTRNDHSRRQLVERTDVSTCHECSVPCTLYIYPVKAKLRKLPTVNPRTKHNPIKPPAASRSSGNTQSAAPIIHVLPR